MANFTSDNCSGILPEILEALTGNNNGVAASYGADPVTAQAERRFCELFETDATTAFLTTGTAANSLALALYTPSYGAVLCHKHAHIRADEYGAPGQFTGGAQLWPVEGDNGKIDPYALRNELARLGMKSAKPCMLSLTQATESGTLYSLDELAELAGIAKHAGLKVHMDGARFAGAIAALGCSPAAMTWKLGVDVLSFGATKNGGLAAEAVILFDTDLALKEALLLRRKKAGHTVSKMRFISCQFLAYLENGLWLRAAAHANHMAKELAAALTEKTGCTPPYPVQVNEVFMPLTEQIAQEARRAGHQFHAWHDGSSRFVTSFATMPDDIAALARSITQSANLL